MTAKTTDQLALENEELRHLLTEAEDTIRALRGGEVDAILVGTESEEVYTLDAAHRPYRLLVERMHVAAASCTTDGIILHGNGAFANFLGLPREAIVGKSIYDFVAAESRGAFEALLHDALEASARAKITFLCSDSSTVCRYLDVSPFREGPLGLCLIVTDLTAEKQFEELQRTQDALREADRRKNEFVAVLAHELRNPLGPIRNAVRIVKTTRPDDPELKIPIEIIERQLEQLARLLDDLLDVSRIARGALEMRRERVSLAEIVNASASAYRDELRSRGIELHVTLSAGHTEWMADRARLIQMLSNLIANAAKYTGSGGKVEVSAAPLGDMLRFSVRDNGIGIPRERLADIFELFEQVDRSAEREGGLGIGLTLVRQIAALHGGSVEAKSEGLGRGSEFIVDLPLVPLAAATMPPAPAKPRVTPRRVLVVDDNPDAVASLAMLLEIGGNEVHRAVDGETAIALAEKVRPDVVLLDLGMPKVSGYEVARRIREQPWGKDPRLIAISGWGQEDARQLAQEAGFDAHLVKPVDPEVLVEILGSLVSRSSESVSR